MGYTADCASYDGVEVAYTPESKRGSCSVLPPDDDYEGKSAAIVLELLPSDRNLHRIIGLALVNALNHDQASNLPKDRGNSIMFDTLDITEGTRVAIVGNFAPIATRLKERGAIVEVFDRGKGIGDEQLFMNKLESWAEVAIVTSTSIINSTLDGLLDQMGKDVRVALMAPQRFWWQNHFKVK